MNIRLLSIGKTNIDYARAGIDLYVKRIGHYLKFRYVELPEVKGRFARDTNVLVNSEGEMLLRNIGSRDIVILFDEKGKQVDSVQFAGMLEKFQVNASGDVVFVIGGAYGFSGDMYKRANSLVSLSALTFNHQLARVVALEQIYRACTIIRGEPYHHA